MSDISQSERWRVTGRLAGAVLAATVLVILFFLSLVETPGTAGYPLGLVAAASGLPVVLAVMVFWFARRQESIDRRRGLFED